MEVICSVDPKDNFSPVPHQTSLLDFLLPNMVSSISISTESAIIFLSIQKKEVQSKIK